MVGPEWCTKYTVENDLVDTEITHAIFNVETPPDVTGAPERRRKLPGRR